MVHLYSDLNDHPSQFRYCVGLSLPISLSAFSSYFFARFLFHNAFISASAICLGRSARECTRHLPLVTRECRYPRAVHEERLAGVTLEYHVATIALEHGTRVTFLLALNQSKGLVNLCVLLTTRLHI